jgi:DNA-binding FadR family transcriptional regulator
MSLSEAEATESPAGRLRTDWVYKRLRDRFRAGLYQPRTRLPTERELSVEFGVSRPVIRGALARLREDGLVRSVQGSGSFVTAEPAPEDFPLARTSVRELQRCFEFRVLIEGEAAYLAAKRGGAAELAAIRANIEAVERSRLARDFKAGESFDFHRAVARASDNEFLMRALDSLAAFAGFRVYMGRSMTLADPGERVALINSEHAAILQLIERREAEEARDAMERHIERARDVFMECLPIGQPG